MVIFFRIDGCLIHGQIATTRTKAVSEIQKDVLFACGLTGGSSFKEAAILCAERKSGAVIAGLNTAAYRIWYLTCRLKTRRTGSRGYAFYGGNFCGRRLVLI